MGSSLSGWGQPSPGDRRARYPAPGSGVEGHGGASPGPLPGGTVNSVFQKLGSLNSEPALPSTSYLPATPSAVPASSYVPSSESPAGEPPTGERPLLGMGRSSICLGLAGTGLPWPSEHLCRALLELLLVLTCQHEFPGRNPKFSRALPFLGANRQREPDLREAEGGGLADRASESRGPLKVPGFLKKRWGPGNGLSSGALAPRGLTLPARSLGPGAEVAREGCGGQQRRGAGGGGLPVLLGRWGDLGLHVSSAGVEKPETFGFEVRVSGGSCPPVGCKCRPWFRPRLWGPGAAVSG